MRKRLKIILGITVSFLIIFTAGTIVVWKMVTRSFPQVDGEILIAGLQESVTVNRDAYGVPHIVASNEHDLFFAQGYVQAQDRLWQMELSRRAGEGRLSEILGPSTVKFDRMLKTIGFKRIAKRLEHQLHPESREILEAYTEGVNAFITTHRGSLPIEFDMLNFTPEPWTPVSTLMISRLMAWELNIGWYVDLTLGELVLKLGEEKAKQVFPTYPENGPLIVPKALAQKPLGKNDLALMDIDKAFRDFFQLKGTHIGSNAWAIGPQKSLSGKAMLANDPHLSFSVPGKWYELHLTGGRYDVAGVSIAGAPLTVIGHNHAIAWGMTNVMADDCDFFIEQEDSLSKEKYLYKGSWLPYAISHDTIWVKDSTYIPLTIRSTVHGPIINEINPTGGITNGQPIAMRWTGLDTSEEIQAMMLINKATNWDEFRAGVKEFAVPGQNFVYADSAGNIGYQPGVRLPIRPAQNPTLPVPGWSGQYDWTGFVPFDELPRIFNPPEHFIATANNKMTDKFPYHISNLWEPPSRIQRMRELLSTQDSISVEDVKYMQMDFYSYFAHDVTPFLLQAYDSVTVQDPEIKIVLRYFRNWHFQLLKDDVPTMIFHATLTHLLQNTFQDEMGKELYEHYVFIANMPYRVILTLLSDNNAQWFDDISTPTVETRDEIIRKSINQALTDLRQRIGGEMREWRWGTLHTITFPHLFGNRKPLDKVFNIGPYEIGGSGTSLNNGEYRFSEPYEVTLGPSMRKIVDFADLNDALSVIPCGQSGQPFHDHYADQAPLWLHGEYHQLPLDSASIEPLIVHRLRLIPASHD